MAQACHQPASGLGYGAGNVRVLLGLGCAHQVREQLPQLPGQVGGTAAFSVRAHIGVRYHQLPAGLCHHQVQVKPLLEAVLPGSRRQLQPVGREELPLLVGKKASLILAGRDNAVIDPQEKQYLDVGQPGADNVPYHHPVHGGRNHAYGNLPKACVQNLHEFLPPCPLVSQKVRETS